MMDQSSSAPLAPEHLLRQYGIGLTGGIATGKSTVARVLERKGYVVLDADQMARAVTAKGSPGLGLLVQAFGADVLNATSELDRRKLAALVFDAPEKKARLEAITHPLIRSGLAIELERLGLTRTPRLFFYEAALLFETGSEGRFRELWATITSPEIQLARVMKRDGRSLAEAEKILAAQLPAAEKARRARVAIDTTGTLGSVEEKVERELAALLLRVKS